VTVTIRDAAGNPLRSFRAMNMYMAGGQFEEFGVGTPVGQGDLAWVCGKARADAVTALSLSFSGLMLMGRLPARRNHADGRTERGEDKLTSSASIQILDINGQLIQSGDATETAARFK
jgi:hypothetical protein